MVPAEALKTIVLVGPTAVGKSSLAVECAKKLRGKKAIEIINADSVCFYREFNIGSAKPTASDMQEVPHHLIDIADPMETYHAGRFLADCKNKIAEIHARGARAIVVGGSGFYLKALRLGLWEAPPTSPDFRRSLDPLNTEDLYEKLLSKDEVHAKKIGPNDRYRIVRALEIIQLSGKKPSELEAGMDKTPDPAFALWSIDREKEDLERRIRERIAIMIQNGWISEVMHLRDHYPLSKTLHAVGYQQVLDFIEGIEPEGRKVEPGIPGLINEIELAHRQLAKSQRTWIKGLNPDEQFLLPMDSDRFQQAFAELVQNT